MTIVKNLNYNGRFKRLSLRLIFFKGYLSLVLCGSLGSYLLPIKVVDFRIMSERSLFFPFKGIYNIFFQNLDYMLAGLNHGYFVDFRINGIGYKVQSFRYNIAYELGHSHYVIYKLPLSVASGKAKYRGVIFGNLKYVLFSVGRQIKNIDFPDSYKGKGFRYSFENLKLKVGKQRQR